MFATLKILDFILKVTQVLKSIQTIIFAGGKGVLNW